MAERMLRSRNLVLFEQLVKGGADPMLAASTLENTIVSLRRDGVAIEPDKALPELFALYKKGGFVKAAIPDILKEMAKGKTAADAAKDYSLLSGPKLETIAKELNYDIKSIMSKYRTRVDPKELESILRKRKPKD